MLRDEIRRRMREAMKARRTVEKEILRVCLGEIDTQESRAGKELDAAAVEKILRKLVKSNRETIGLTEDDDRKRELEQENEVLEALLPKTLTEDEVVAALEDVKDAVLAAGSDGQATGVAMKHLKGQGAAVDGRTGSAAVQKIRT